MSLTTFLSSAEEIKDAVVAKKPLQLVAWLHRTYADGRTCEDEVACAQGEEAREVTDQFVDGE